MVLLVFVEGNDFYGFLNVFYYSRYHSLPSDGSGSDHY
jgi:hypothetical protein